MKDIGDWITRRLIEDAKSPEAIAATLDEHWRRSDPWCGAAVSDLWASAATWKPVTYVGTGLVDLDSALNGGFRTRGVHLLAGKPSKGKSQLAVCIATNAARSQRPTAIFSLEMAADEIAQLVAAQLGGIPRNVLASGRPIGEYGDRLNSVVECHAKIPLSILDAARWQHGLTRNGFAALLGEGVKRFGWRLVVLDYLGLLCALDTDRSEYTSDLLNSAALRRAAQEHDVALVVVVALRKSANFKKPQANETTVTLDDVAGAGRLAYDAQTVMAVAGEHGDEHSGIMHVRPLKIRFAPCTEGQDIQLRWWPSTGAIGDLR